MTDLAALIARYPDLPPEERADVDARLAGHPALAGAHAEAVALAAVLDAARTPADPARADPARAVPARAERQRDDDLDPAALFEELAGFPLSEVEGLDAQDEPPAAPMTLLAASRPPLRRLWLPRVAAAAAVALVGYGALFAWSAASVSERAQVAALGEVAPVDVPVLRGPAVMETDERLQAALAEVAAARRSWLGLFPSYDAGRLDAAAGEIAAVVGEVDPGSWMSHEGRLALGRIHLYRGRDAEAVRVLGTLVEEGSYRGAVARRLIDSVR